MYAQVINTNKNFKLLYQCQDCQESFAAMDGAPNCPCCYSADRSNLVILHMEEDEERAEWLALVDFSAGD